MPKYIFVVGGVMSSVGKGITASAIGALLKARGFRVSAMKIDPYVNVDAGTMNPTEHGEVFVTKDGDETDQDMGNYERFLDEDLTSINYMTTGRVYRSVIEAERAMKYKGKCVQVVPHIPQEIIRRIKVAQQAHRAEVMIIEIGGTAGEYENILFLEAARMMKLKNPGDVIFILVSFLPVPSHLGEMKTKPTQHASRALNSVGINADFIVARGRYELDKPRREKLAVLCGVRDDYVIAAPDVPSIYQVPIIFESQGFTKKLMQCLGIAPRQRDLVAWRALVRKIDTAPKTARIGVVGKYFGTGNFTLSDSYISVIEAVKHAAWSNGAKPELTWIDAEEYEKNPKKVRELIGYDGIIVPGGFGERGIEGIIKAIRFAREERIPFLGLCYGMQLAVIEFARNVAGLRGAHTTEVGPDAPHPVIHVMEHQRKVLIENRYGGTMRLGAYPCALRSGTRAQAAYGIRKISERHRHRYEFNNKYRVQFEKLGLIPSGVSPDNQLVEIVELKDHPFFVGTQFHPEFQSRPLRPHPLFREFICAALKKR